MTWDIVVAALIGIIAAYLFRYQAQLTLPLHLYLVYEWRALAKGFIGAAGVILLWAYIEPVLAWLGSTVAIPPIEPKLACVIGFAGRDVYKYTPNVLKMLAEALGRRFK